MTKTAFAVALFSLFLAERGIADNTPPPVSASATQPIRFVGERVPDEYFYDGRLPHAVGVHHYQVYRANRLRPIEGDDVGWTYNHQPYIAYWNGTFYMQFLSNVYEEHGAPGKTQIVTSRDGRSWSDPVVVFPEYMLPEIKNGNVRIEAGKKSVMHQRMGFYVAPNGKLLTLGFYGYSATPRHSPNKGNGVGRVVREVKKDGTLGPVYFIRYNRHAGWNESNTNYPFYQASDDEAFLEACESLLADKLMTLQWWEEDRADDGFFSIVPGETDGGGWFAPHLTSLDGSGKAFNYYRRPDGVLVGIWKSKYSALSADNGQTWTRISKNESLLTDGAKTWGQQTGDGRYVVVHNQSATQRNRYPMTSMTSEDGHIFDDLLALRNDIPPRRYQGIHKRHGTHYYRGIFPGNGNPPGDETWIVYTVNKEDVWVARLPKVITGVVSGNVNQDFDAVESIMQLDQWSVYEPEWTSFELVEDPHERDNKALEIRDAEPLDYARLERILPEAKTMTVGLRVNAREIPLGYALNVEVQDTHGSRPLRIRFDQKWISVDLHNAVVPNPIAISMDAWYDIELHLSADTQSYSMTVNGEVLGDDIPFATEVDSLQRLVFRTGPYRGKVTPVVLKEATTDPAGINTEDIAGTESPVSPLVFLIDDVRAERAHAN